MHSAEWSLVFFTLLSQFSAGLLLSMFIFRMFLSTDSNINKDKLTFICSVTGFITMLGALVISFLHLNAPSSSVYAMSNLGESWLSREILTASLFAFLLFLLVVASGYKLVSVQMQNFLMLLVVITGFYLIYSMGRLYMIPTVPAWNHPGTMLAFFATAFLTGPAGFLAVHTKIRNPDNIRQKPATLLLIYSALMLAGMLMVIAATLFARAEINNLANVGFAAQSFSPFLTISRWLLLLMGLAAITGTSGILNKPQTSLLSSTYFWGFVLIFVSEILDRIDFYSSYFKIGL